MRGSGRASRAGGAFRRVSRWSVALCFALPGWALPPPAAIPVTGTLLDESGAPLEGAEVTLHPIAGEREATALRLQGETHPEPVLRGRTGGDGRFRLEPPSPGFWTVVVRSKGRAALGHSVGPLLPPPPDAPPVAGRELAPVRMLAAHEAGEEEGLPGGWRLVEASTGNDPALTGQPTRPARVARPDGRPAEGALVWTIWGPLGRTDADGRIDVPVIEGRSHRVQVASDDGLSASVLVKTSGQATEETLYLTLQPSLEVAGRVVDAEDGEPVAGALVWASGGTGREVLTGPDGAFRLDVAAAPGSAVLNAAAPGFEVARQPLRREGGAFAEDVVVELQATAWIEGKTVDAGGRPVAGAWVGALPSEELSMEVRLPVPETWTGPDGEFLLEGLDPGQPYQIRAHKPEHATAVAEVPPAARGEGGHPVPPPPLRLVLGEPRRLTGRVVDEAGRPFPGAQVTLVPGRWLGDENLWVSVPELTRATDAEGRFEFENPLPIASLLAVRAPAYAPLFRHQEDLDPVVTDVGELVLEPEAFLRGRVVDSEGRPVAGAEVREGVASSPSFLRHALFRQRGHEPPAVTDADGSFSLGRLIPAEPVQLEVLAAGFAPKEIWFVATPEGAPVVVELRAEARVSGRVTDAEGRPVSRATVGPSGRHAAGGHFRWVVTDGSGRFEIDEAPPGRLYLVADARGHARSEPMALDLAPGEHRDGVVLALRRGYPLSGRLLQADGEPARGIRVWEASGSQAVTTDEDGRFSISDRPLGPATLRVDREGFLPFEAEVEVEPGGAPVEVRLPAAEVRGVLLARDGTPVPGREIQLLERASGVLSSSAHQVVTAADGSFRFRGVPDGTYVLRLFGPEWGWDGWTHPDPVVVEDGRSVTGLAVREPSPDARSEEDG